MNAETEWSLDTPRIHILIFNCFYGAETSVFFMQSQS